MSERGRDTESSAVPTPENELRETVKRGALLLFIAFVYLPVL